MTGETIETTPHVARDHDEWRARPLILAGLGLVVALIIQQLVDRSYVPGVVTPDLAPWRIALATGVGSAVMAIGFGLERVRLLWAMIFAGVVGVAAGLILYWQGGSGWNIFGEWSSASLFLAIAIAVPLFQTARDEGRWRFPYEEVHGHAWTNVVLWFACWAFVGVVFLLAWLLAALFDLIGLKFLTDLLGKDWFNAGLAGAAFGGSLGVLRERDRVVRLLQRVVTAVLAVLAPVLGIGLLIFLGALPFTGLGALWEATKSTTPILLGCVIGALILANAVIGNGEEDEATNPIMRWGALALALAILPLAMIAAVAIGARIGQYGFTPDRLWALIFVILASGYGVVYLVALVRGRLSWAPFARASNLTLAFVVAGVALFLATPILSFNAISVRDQVGRLESGRIAPEKFDWPALAFDFGDPGKAALKRLAGSANPAFARPAKSAAAKTSRYEVTDSVREQRALDSLSARLRILPATVPLPDGLRAQLSDYGACGRDDDKCTLLYSAGATEAVVVGHPCIEKLAAAPTKSRKDTANRIVYSVLERDGANCSVRRYRLVGGKWVEAGAPALEAGERAALGAGLSRGEVEVRTVPRRQVFVGGVPVGDPFE